jgi:protein-S-isoprenylcysteine O-methyltransferase Ste14
LKRSKQQGQHNRDKHSLLLIWATIFVAIFSSIYVSLNYHFPILDNIYIGYIGLIIIIVGTIFRIMITKSLGEYFTADVTIKSNHKLKKDGFYKFLRHPIYFVSLTTFIGFGISLNNCISLIITFILITSALIYRIKVEEKVLIQQFGDEYLEYKKSTKGLIPFVY